MMIYTRHGCRGVEKRNEGAGEYNAHENYSPSLMLLLCVFFSRGRRLLNARRLEKSFFLSSQGVE